MTVTSTSGDATAPAAPAPRPKPSWAMVGIFLILAFGAITLAKAFLMPVTLAFLLFFVFAPLCRILSRIGVPQALSAAVVTIGLFAGLVVATTMFSVPISSAVDNAPRIFQAIETKLSTLQGSVEELQDAAERIRNMTASAEKADPDAVPATTVVMAQGGSSGFVTGLVTMTPSVFGQFIFTLVLLFFTLASRELMYLRTVQSFSRFRDKRSALDAMHAIERSLGYYLGTITLINAGLGIAIGLGMWAWDMPAPALFGIAAFALNYIPYVGAIGGTILATLVALVIKDGLLAPILVGGTYLLLTSIEGQLITPYFLSQRLRLNTVVVFISVALFAWLWSVVGMIVAVPLLVVLQVVCSYVPGMENFANFLSGKVNEDLDGTEDTLTAQTIAPVHSAQ